MAKTKKQLKGLPEPEKKYLKGFYPLLWMAIIAFVLYGQTISYSYCYLDDNALILDQMEKLKDISYIPQTFKEDAFHTTAGTGFYYRPLLTTSFVIDAAIGDGNFRIFHISNIIYHILAAFFLFLLLVELGYDRMKCFLFGLIFLVHPVLTHAVAWVPGRNDSLLAIFLFPSFLFLLRYLKNGKIGDLVVHLILYILALFSKETAIVIPAVALVYMLFIHRRWTAKSFYPIIAWVIITPIWMKIRFDVLGGSHGYPMADSIESIITNLLALLTFFGKTLFPFQLSVFPILPDMQVSLFLGILCLIILFVIFIFTRNKRLGYWLFAIAWFIGFIILSFIKTKSQKPDFTEHRVYISMLGFFILFLESDLLRKANVKNIFFRISFIAIIILFAFLTFKHSRHYKDRLAFWTNAVETSPTHAFNFNNLGAMYFLDGDLVTAEKLFRQAIRINPEEPLANGNLGLVLMRTERPAEAEKYYLKEVEINPLYDNVYYNLGLLYLNAGLTDQAIVLWEKTLQINPYYSDAYHGLAMIYEKLKRQEDYTRIIEMAKKNGLLP
ncbi:MAG: tetratricopeptide repeat protein [Bacteroidetes bacterium]|nr:tetratricopeptide repeat protein [Bacteroidota bacterium]